MSIDQQNHSAIFAELFDQLPDDKFAKPQIDIKVAENIDLAKAMKQSLAAPEYYPPLSESVFPGDSIAIVLQTDLPHPNLVLDVLIGELCSLDVAVSDIVVVVTRRTADALGLDPKLYEVSEENSLEGSGPAIFPVEYEFNTINFQIHDPENQAGHSYLVANLEGDPIHVNRILVDSDVLIPVGCPMPGEASQQNDCVYPNFGNEASMIRFGEDKGSFVSRWQEIELVNDTMGAFFSIQIVCGPGDSIRQVRCGARKDAISSARAETNKLWMFEWRSNSDVVVATIETHPHDQNWDDFANALVAASRVSKTDSPIVIWSEIGVNPDRNTRKAMMSQFEDGISAKLSKILQRVSVIVQDRPVYLKSGLSRNVVEGLGLGFVESAAEVVRIAEPYEEGLVIRDAHKCQIPNEAIGDDPQDEDSQ